MKSYWFAALTAVALLSAGAANANEDLAKKSACMACHKVEGKLVGPGYKDVAKKYAGDAGAEAKLIAKVKAVVLVFGARSRCRRMPRFPTQT